MPTQTNDSTSLYLLRIWPSSRKFFWGKLLHCTISFQDVLSILWRIVHGSEKWTQIRETSQNCRDISFVTIFTHHQYFFCKLVFGFYNGFPYLKLKGSIMTVVKGLSTFKNFSGDLGSLITLKTFLERKNLQYRPKRNIRCITHVCTERTFDRRPVIYHKIFLKQDLNP